MFFSVSMCAVEPIRGNIMTGEEPSFSKAHQIAAGADALLGIALLAIGILAAQFGFLPSNMQYALIGAGTAYSWGILCVVGLLIKFVKAPDSYLIKQAYFP